MKKLVMQSVFIAILAHAYVFKAMRLTFYWCSNSYLYFNLRERISSAVLSTMMKALTFALFLMLLLKGKLKCNRHKVIVKLIYAKQLLNINFNAHLDVHAQDIACKLF